MGKKNAGVRQWSAVIDVNDRDIFTWSGDWINKAGDVLMLNLRFEGSSQNRELGPVGPLHVKAIAYSASTVKALQEAIARQLPGTAHPCTCRTDGISSCWLADFRNAEVSTDLADERVRNLTVPRNRFDGTGSWVLPEGVGRAFSLEDAAVAAQVPEKTAPLHFTVTVSFSASGGTPLSPSSRRS